jgi:hypothetical protein
MESQVALSYVAVVAVALAAVVGLAILSLVCRAFWKTMRLAASALAFALIGAMLLTAPKWTEAVIEISELRLELKTVSAQRAQLSTKVAELDAQKANARVAIVKAIRATNAAKQQRSARFNLDEATKQLNNALEMSR